MLADARPRSIRLRWRLLLRGEAFDSGDAALGGVAGGGEAETVGLSTTKSEATGSVAPASRFCDSLLVAWAFQLVTSSAVSGPSVSVGCQKDGTRSTGFGGVGRDGGIDEGCDGGIDEGCDGARARYTSSL